MNEISSSAFEKDHASATELAESINEQLGHGTVQLGSALLKRRDRECPNSQRGRVKATVPDVWDQAGPLTSRLVPIESACAQLGLSRSTFWRFRKRHRIKVLPGHRIYIDDIVEAFEAERRGCRRKIA